MIVFNIMASVGGILITGVTQRRYRQQTNVASNFRILIIITFGG